MKWPIPRKLNDIQVPIFTLAHVTHNTEASEICRDFEFKANRKFGKVLGAFDGRPCGESFRQSQAEPGYFQINADEAMLPGYYSWWGIFPEWDDHGGEYISPAEVKTELDTLKREGLLAFVPGYIKSEPESIYGNCAFTCKFQNLLRAYARSRGKQVSKVCIRKGGTLRYSKEICYVLIDWALSEFAPLEEASTLFHTNGLIDSHGIIADDTSVPTFHPKHIIPWIKHVDDTEPEKHSYETAAIAFYFPKEGGKMKLDNYECFHKKVGHKKCIKTQPPEWTCPNDLD